MSRTTSWRALIKVLLFARPHWPMVLLSIGATMGFSSLEGLFAYILKPFVNEFVKHGTAGESNLDVDTLFRIGRYALLLAPAIALFDFLKEYLRGRLLWTLITDVRNAVCRAVVPQSLSYFEDRRSGDLMSRTTNDVGAASTVFTMLYGGLPENAALMLVGVFLACTQDWKLLLGAAVLAPAFVAPVSHFARRIRRYGKQSLERLADLTDVMAQIFSGIRVIKAFKMEDAEIQEFERANRRVRSRMVKGVMARSMGGAVIELFIRLMMGGVIVLVAWAIARNRMGISMGSLTVFVYGVYMAFNGMRKTVKSYNALQEAMPAADRLFEMIDHIPELKDAPDAVELPEVRKGIAFRDVSFAYDGEPVLRNVSFEANKGETIALVGRSGAGKSTLIALICRFYDVTSGLVEIDGLDVRRIRRSSLLDRIAIVSQQTFLFNRSVAENIRYGKRDATPEEVEAAARAANIHDFIASLPDGYAATCGEFGAKLSGGQRQRIAIARALLKNADILILDEAMTGLDVESEAAVRQALENLMRGRTTFVVTHDVPTIQHADRILVLQGGALIAQGTHGELMRHCPEYVTLYGAHFDPGSERPNA